MARTVGYARVSTDDQTTALQADALRTAGVEDVYEDVGASGASRARRPSLARALASLGPGDVLVVWRLDRLARSVRDLLAIIAEVEAAGASLRSLTEAVDTGSAVGRLLLNVLASIGQFERDLTVERVNAGIRSAKARGTHCGRPPALPEGGERAALLRKLVADGESVSGAARAVGVSRASAYRTLARTG